MDGSSEGVSILRILPSPWRVCSRIEGPIQELPLYRKSDPRIFPDAYLLSQGVFSSVALVFGVHALLDVVQRMTAIN